MILKYKQNLKADYDNGLKEVLKKHRKGSAVHQSYIHNFLVKKIYGKQPLRKLIIELKKRLQYVVIDDQFERMTEYHYLDAIISEFFELADFGPIGVVNSKDEIYEQFSKFAGVEFPHELRV